jgi:hypothetical protein
MNAVLLFVAWSSFSSISIAPVFKLFCVEPFTIKFDVTRSCCIVLSMAPSTRSASNIRRLCCVAFRFVPHHSNSSSLDRFNTFVFADVRQDRRDAKDGARCRTGTRSVCNFEVVVNTFVLFVFFLFVFFFFFFSVIVVLLIVRNFLSHSLVRSTQQSLYQCTTRHNRTEQQTINQLHKFTYVIIIDCSSWLLLSLSTMWLSKKRLPSTNSIVE